VGNGGGIKVEPDDDEEEEEDEDEDEDEEEEGKLLPVLLFILTMLLLLSLPPANALGPEPPEVVRERLREGEEARRKELERGWPVRTNSSHISSKRTERMLQSVGSDSIMRRRFSVSM